MRDMNGNIILGRDGAPKPFHPSHMPTVAILGPKGEISHHKARDNGGGDSVCKWDPNGSQLIIPRKWQEKGWIFYWDVCQGNYTPKYGGEAVRDPSKYELWEAAVKEIEDGYEGAPTGRDFYHPEVIARRDNRRGAREVKPGSVFDHQAGAEIEAKAQEKAKAKRRGRPPKQEAASA